MNAPCLANILMEPKFPELRTPFFECWDIWNVAKLIDETVIDLRSLERCQIVINIPEKWDTLSYKWKQHITLRWKFSKHTKTVRGCSNWFMEAKTEITGKSTK